MPGDRAERVTQTVSLAVTAALVAGLLAWRPVIPAGKLPRSAAADVELSVEAPSELPSPEPPAPPAPELPPAPTELPPPKPLPVPPSPPAPVPAVMLSPPSPVRPLRVPRAAPPRPVVQAAPPVPATPAPPSAAAPPSTAGPIGSPSADSSYTGSVRAIIDRRNVPPDNAEYRFAHPHGTAEIGYTVARNGMVSAIAVVRSSGSAILDRQAVANVSTGGFPAMPDQAFAGQAQRRFTIRITFNPTGSPVGDYDP